MKNLSSISKSLLIIAAAAYAAPALTSTDVPELTALQCMTANLYFEARGEPKLGQKAVANVTRSRVKSKRYPNKVCAVVFQKWQFSWTHEQSWGNIDKILQGSVGSLPKADKEAYNSVKRVSKAVLQGETVLPEEVMHYHKKKAQPYWAKKLEVYGTIGKHIYYGKRKEIK